MQKKCRYLRRDLQEGERGQSFMELAISMVFLLVLLSAIIDLGWAFYSMTALRDTAQEAASYGVMCPDRDKILERLRLSTSAPLNASDIDNGNVNVVFLRPGVTDPVTDPKHGDIVRVEVEIEHTIMVPFLGAVINRYTYPLKVDVSDTIMVDKCPGPT